MSRFVSACSGLAMMLWLGAVLGAEPVRVVIASPNNPALAQAAREFERRHGHDLIELVSCSPEITPDRIGDAKAIFFTYVNSAAFQRTAAAVRRAHRKGAAVFSLPSDSAGMLWNIHAPPALSQTVERYWRGGSVENLVGLLATLYKAGGGKKQLRVAPPGDPVSAGLYHPDSGVPFHALKDYLAWYRQRPGIGPATPLVGVSFYSNAYKFADLAYIDALIRKLEQAGVGAVGVFGGTLADMAPLLDVDGRCPLRLLLAMNLTMSRASNADVLAARRLHVLHLFATRESAALWAASKQGLPAARIPLLYGAPERVGATEGILIGTTENDAATGAGRTMPVEERIDAVVKRVRKWIALQDKPRPERRVALIYYNNPPGKGNFGASYLNVPASLVELLRTLRHGGYRTGERDLTERELLSVLELCGRNVGEWAPGEVEKLVTAGRATLLPVARYREWFAQLPAAFRDQVNAKWGQPEASPMMTLRAPDGRAYFVIPGVRLGNVFVGPQPFRSQPRDASASAHDAITPPPHSYIAWYLWLRHQFQADAAVHVGRHGTLEWLPGKSVALSGDDCPEAVLGDLPDVYFYIVDGGGEAIQAKRRGAAVLISHRTPLMVTSGVRAELRELETLLDREASVEGDGALSRGYRDQISAAARRLKLGEQLGADLDKTPWPDLRGRLKALLEDTEDTPIPLGLPVIGVAEDASRRREALAEFLRSRFQTDVQRRFATQWQAWAGGIAEGRAPAPAEGETQAVRDKLSAAWTEGERWIEDLRRSPQLERDAFLAALDGQYLPSGMLGDPLRQPDVLPTGRNLHSFDAGLLPTKAAWETGQRLADEYLARFLREKRAYPEKVSLVLWFGESMRHHGSFEAMGMWLLGVEPVWNGRGQVDELRLIPDAELKRPRVDVVFAITSLYRDAVPHLAVWLDRAAKLAATAGESAITRNSRAAEQELLRRGATAAKATELARSRVYSTTPGTYGTPVGRLVVEGTDNTERLGNAYLDAMGRVFGEKLWGEPVPGGLRTQLRGNQAVLFSRSSNLYGASDTHDVYETFGALGTASKVVNGSAPDMLIQNLRKAGEERQQSMRSFLLAELNARQWNPLWISEMQKAGYAGARQFTKQTEALAGITATSPESVDPAVWEKTFQVYVRDQYGLGMEQFFEKSNPAARQQQLARFLEVERRGALRLNAEDRALLVSAYVRSVARSGVACSALVCGNRTLRGYVTQTARATNAVSASELSRFADAVRAAVAPPAAPPRPMTPARGGAVRGAAVARVGKMRVFSIEFSPEQWRNGFAAVGTLAVDPRVWAGVGALYSALLLLVTAIKQREQRRVHATQLHLNAMEDSSTDAHR